MKSLRWALPFVFVFICFSLYAGWLWLSPPLPAEFADKGLLGDSFGVLNSLFSGLGFAAVVVTIWIQQGQIRRQEQERIEEVAERRSLFNLNAALQATDQARALLKDQKNDRRTWIEAGRLLGHAKVLGQGVTVDCHQRVLEANRLKYRTFFSGLLENKTAAYFYGGTDKMSTLDAGRASTRPITDPKTNTVSDLHYLDEASIYRIWEAAQWPEDFDDPVGQKFSDEERDKLRFRARGLREYLEHMDKYTPGGGEMFLRRKPTVEKRAEN